MTNTVLCIVGGLLVIIIGILSVHFLVPNNPKLMTLEDAIEYNRKVMKTPGVVTDLVTGKTYDECEYRKLYGGGHGFGWRDSDGTEHFLDACEGEKIINKSK